jgi:hypothetical protein
MVLDEPPARVTAVAQGPDHEGVCEVPGERQVPLVSPGPPCVEEHLADPGGPAAPAVVA